QALLPQDLPVLRVERLDRARDEGRDVDAAVRPRRRRGGELRELALPEHLAVLGPDRVRLALVADEVEDAVHEYGLELDQPLALRELPQRPERRVDVGVEEARAIPRVPVDRPLEGLGLRLRLLLLRRRGGLRLERRVRVRVVVLLLDEREVAGDRGAGQ